MDELELDEIYGELILDLVRSPKFKYKLDTYTCNHAGKNPMCGDSIVLFANIIDKKIENISFLGAGCVISMASTEMMCKIFLKKEISEIKNTLEKIINAGKTTDFNKLEISGGSELEIFNGVKKFPLRMKCLMLPYRVLEEILK